MRPAVAALVVLLLPATAVGAFAASAPVPVPPQAVAALAAHHALYELTFHPGNNSDVVAVRGTMGYEVVDACDGWAVRQRLQMTITNTEGQNIQMASDYATWESKDGMKLRFHMKQMTDTAVTSQTDGEASLKQAGGTGEVHYTSPRDEKVALEAGPLFPMMHTAAIIAAAHEGKKFITLPLFDGTDENGPQDSSIAILDWKAPFETKYPVLSGLPSTRVRLAFFDKKPGTTTPSYEVGMRYWQNGIADDMLMDFGDFAVDAKMTELKAEPRRC